MIRITFDGGTSLANRVACRGFAPPFPPIKTKNVDSVPGGARDKGVKMERLTVPSFICSNQPKVLTLRLCTFSHTTTHSTFELMW
jgi:hypothetical protein